MPAELGLTLPPSLAPGEVRVEGWEPARNPPQMSGVEIGLIVQEVSGSLVVLSDVDSIFGLAARWSRGYRAGPPAHHQTCGAGEEIVDHRPIFLLLALSCRLPSIK